MKQADQGDLEAVNEEYADKEYETFRLAIDEAPKSVPPAGSRIISIEKVQRVLDVLGLITGESVKQGPGIIIKEYLLGEKEKTKKGESEDSKQAQRSAQIEQRFSCTHSNY